MDVFIGGFGDRFSGIVSGYRKAFAAEHPERRTASFHWHQGSRAMAAIRAVRAREPHEPIHVIGHSYGAATAVALTRALHALGIDVALLITIDPVSRVRPRGPARATRWINVNARPMSSNGLRGDWWSAWGGQWRGWPQVRAHAHCDAPYHHNEFTGLFEFVPPGGRSARDLLLAAQGKARRAA